MLQVGDKVRIKADGFKVGKVYNGVLYTEAQDELKGFSAEVLSLVGADKCSLDLAPDTIFHEEMLEIIEKAPVVREVSAPAIVTEGQVDKTGEKREEVLKRLQEFESKIDGLLTTDAKMYFELLHDKLHSLLYEVYGG